MEDATNKEVELSHFNHVVAGLQERVLTLENEQQFLLDFEKKLQEQIVGIEGELIKVRENITSDSRKLDAKQNEYNLTKSMVDNLEGFPESIRFLKKNADWVKDVPLFSDILFCREIMMRPSALLIC
jgi:chromosome segregation protein